MNVRYNYVRVAAAIPKVRVADIPFNAQQIKASIMQAASAKADVVVFPEMSLTGYTCADLFHTNNVLKEVNDAVQDIANFIFNEIWFKEKSNTIAIIGAPRFNGKSLYNSAYVLAPKVRCTVDKTYLPNYNEFYEKRWFKPSDHKNNTIIEVNGKYKFGIEICEDVWAPKPPSTDLSLMGADIIFNLSASNDILGKDAYLRKLLEQQSARCLCGYVYSSCGYGESTQDLVFGGKGYIFENGHMLGQTERFAKNGTMVMCDIDIDAIRHDRMKNITFQDSVINDDINNVDISISDYNVFNDTLRRFNPHPFYSNNIENMNKRCEEIMNIQVMGLARRLEVTNTRPVIGISGGSDSTLALLVAYEAEKFLGRDPHDILGITMPGFATSKRTHSNSDKIMKVLGVDAMTVDITHACKEEMLSIGHPLDKQDITYENVQARMRTSILMNIANQRKGIVVGTGDLSELALGWCTYNADHMSMYGVNCSIPKTLVKREIRWYRDKALANGNKDLADIIDDILDTPVSPELTGSGADGNNAQVTEDKIGPYELHDFFLYNLLRHGYSTDKLLWMASNTHFNGNYSLDDIKKWLSVFMKRFVAQQFKRSCLPDGPKVGSISLSPRGDWRMPTDASATLFIP